MDTCVTVNVDQLLICSFYISGIPHLVITPPEPKRVLFGSKVSYTCEAEGSVCDTLKWSKVSGSVVGVNATPSNRENGTTWRTDLVIEKADFSHSGDYKCELSYGQTILRQRKVKIAVLGKYVIDLHVAPYPYI